MITNYINKGDIFLVELNGRGSVINKTRPCIVLKAISSIATVIPITSKMNKRKLPVHVELWSYQKYGLKSPSTMLIEQIMTISLEHLDRCIGKVSDSETLGNISRAMAIQFPVLAAS